MNPQKIYDLLTKNGYKFFTGVPDSTLKGLISVIENNEYTPSTSEGESIGIATGYYLSTGKVPVIYLQNAGLGNIINPITSLTDELVYDTPLLLLIGWRGKPVEKGAPQHTRMGLITPKLLDLLNIKYELLTEPFEEQIKRINSHFKNSNQPFALLIKKGKIDDQSNNYKTTGLNREEVIKKLIKIDGLFISTTGKTSRELYNLRTSHEKDFYNVGAMGCASAIALGVSLKTEKEIVLLDGDGAALMKMGSMGTIGFKKPKNLTHIILNNNSYQSTGSQKIVNVDFKEIAKGCGYKEVFSIKNIQEINDFIKNFSSISKPSLVEIQCNNKSSEILGRPKENFEKLKKDFMKSLRDKNE